MSEYVLGVNASELDRLRFQQEVWGATTQQFLARLGIKRGARCLDAGCGPGFVIPSLRVICGPSGEVFAIDESPAWIAHVEREVVERGWRNVHPRVMALQNLPQLGVHFDLIFMRWVLSFPADPGALIQTLKSCLNPGGVVAIQDYNHEGVSLFPESAAFKAVIAATRRLYATRGGDPWISARLPRLFAEANLQIDEMKTTVLCGGPESPVFRWAGLFFVAHSARMVEAGVLGASDREQFLQDWEIRSHDPYALFFSPIVVDSFATFSSPTLE